MSRHTKWGSKYSNQDNIGVNSKGDTKGKPHGDCYVYPFDVEHYEKTGEVKRLDKPRKFVPKEKRSIWNGKVLKERGKEHERTGKGARKGSRRSEQRKDVN